MTVALYEYGLEILTMVVIILTACGTIEEAVEAMKLGAYDFIIKTVDL